MPLTSLPSLSSTIPVRGRKPDCSHDGSPLFCTIPVRGRKHMGTTNLNGLRGTIPVRGRKPCDYCSSAVFLGTIPVRGRKPELHDLVTTETGTIPVRGQKTPHQKMRSFSFANLNSLFSVGYSSMNGTIAAAVIFSLLRLLHSDKMCYNKANSKHLLQN